MKKSEIMDLITKFVGSVDTHTRNNIVKLVQHVLNEDEEEDEIGKYLKSDKFREDFARRVEEDTWGKGLPKIYMDKEGNIVEHWKDGTINILK